MDYKRSLVNTCLIPCRNCIEAYSAELKNLAMKLLEFMAKAPNMKGEEMRELFEEGMQSMRMNYYPPCPQLELVIGLTPYSDAVRLAILLQINEMEGLQIKKDGMSLNHCSSSSSHAKDSSLLFHPDSFFLKLSTTGFHVALLDGFAPNGKPSMLYSAVDCYVLNSFLQCHWSVLFCFSVSICNAGEDKLKDGMWIPIKPLPNAFIVNIGDMLEPLTYFPNTP
ncbi:hypothetical protein HYC85_018640 [Camellia sinensis]|uniref:Isopenicillin N synthase-like Fe(2+) 2OG dioxygenase domain-containing protein n=1 Tax=Camellia sinensis TaxID=4442 RepID=A0A7J7GUU0_CAMSI|nr:hypothetical protein HYC85_018640 [Camellia sinensis]